MRIRHRQYYLSHALEQNKKGSNRMIAATTPSCFIQEERSQFHINQRPQNIFQNNEQPRERRLIKEDKEYLFVGYTQLKNYKARMEKKKKIVDGSIKRTIQSFSSRPSINRAQLQNYLTKQEVMQIYTPNSTTKRPQTQDLHRTIQTKTTKGSTAEETSSFAFVNEFNSNVRPNTQDSNKFSLIRLKQKIQDYNKGWQNQIRRKYKSRKVTKNKNKFISVSVLERIQQYRQTMQIKAKISELEKIQNASPKLWNSILRSSNSLLNCQAKDIDHIIKKGPHLKGNNKLYKQIQWLQFKNKQGYFFKAVKLNNQEQVSA